MESKPKHQSTHTLIGLNMPWKIGGFIGYYATVQTGKDDSDWFHSGFDPEIIPIEKQTELWNKFKDENTNIWHGKTHKVVVRSDGIYSDGNPIKPVIIEVILDL